MNVPVAHCVRQTVKVKIPPGHGGEIKRPKETHEGVDKELAALRSGMAVMVTEAPFDRGYNASVDDAGLPRRCQIGRVHGIDVQPNFGHTLQQCGGAEE